jgi:hypothetical protein
MGLIRVILVVEGVTWHKKFMIKICKRKSHDIQWVSREKNNVSDFGKRNACRFLMFCKRSSKYTRNLGGGF